MFYFLRTVLIYLVVFVTIAVGGYRWMVGQHHVANQSGTVTSMMPSHFFAARETQSGLVLAGMAAQNRRDWGQAWQNFSALNSNFISNPETALRAMTLAMGNGDFDQVLEIANSIDLEVQGGAEGFDLVRLFLVIDDIRNAKYDEAIVRNDALQKSVLAQFVSPIIDVWLQAAHTSKDLDASTKKLSDIQLIYKAMAFDFAGQTDKASMIKSNIQNTKIIDDYADVNPTDIQMALSMAFHDFARAMMAERAMDSALLFARMATHLSPENTDVYGAIGAILSFQNQKDGALNAYQKVMPDDTSYQSSFGKSIDILIDDEAYDRAIKIAKNANELAGDDNAYIHYMLGNIYRADKQLKKALAEYNRAEKLGLAQNDGILPRELLPLHYSRAIVYDLLDMWDKAEADLLIAMDKIPNNPIVLNYLGYAYADRGMELEKAKSMIGQALMAAPNDAYIVDSMGWILYRMGMYEQALKYLERAASMRPYHMVINDHLGDVYWKLGRKREAHYMWQRAVDYFDATDEEQARMINETKRKLREGLNNT